MTLQKEQDLLQQLVSLREEVRVARFGMGGANTSANRISRRDIARILTELNRRRKVTTAVTE